MSFALTTEQEDAVDRLASLEKPVMTMGGLGGTGKTTIVKHLVKRLPNFAVCAFTGKAAQVLRSKGVESASTIHSLLYDYDPELGEFLLRPDLGVDGVIVDEGSTVPKQLHEDLSSFGIPLIYIGDHGQLEPIGDTSFNLMSKPDITLETIHRNAGEIAHFANHLRQGGEARDWKSGDKVRILRKDQMDEVDWAGTDQVICAYNQTRVGINQIYRQELGYGSEPQVGDRIMCLQNDKKTRVFNGMQGILSKLDGPYLTMESDGVKYTCRYDKRAFGSAVKPEYQRGIIPFDYAYCVTCHRYQGSEANRVVVLEQKCSKWSHNRWTYTAASRAKEHLTWILDK